MSLQIIMFHNEQWKGIYDWWKRGLHSKIKIGQPRENERHLLVTFEEKWVFYNCFALAKCVLKFKFQNLILELGKYLEQFGSCFSVISMFFHQRFGAVQVIFECLQVNLGETIESVSLFSTTF